jgi:hypothetical protein
MASMGGKRPGAGRPKGQPNRVTKEVREMAGEYGPQALEKIVTLLESDDEKTVLAAAKEVLDRAYGRPKQSHHLEHDMGDGLVERILAGRKRAHGSMVP